MRPGPRELVATVLVAAGAAACGGGSDGPRSALLITLDTTRYDALGCTGAPPGVSPNLDALAAEGVLYEQARTVCPLTMPAHASMLTGLYPLRHTVHVNSQLALPGSAVTLAERAGARGYQTAAFVAAVVLAEEFGLDQGFELYDQPVAPLVSEVHYVRRPADQVADAVVAWLGERDPDRPFLLWTHFFDPHLPLDPPAEFLRRAGGDPYLGAVAFMDHHVGRILDALEDEGLLDETIVVVVADHGEGRGDHGEETHGTLAYDSTIRVPLIVRHPGGWRAGERSEEIVSVADVFPTLVEALGLGGPGDVDGVSLHRRLVPADRGVLYESYYGFMSYSWSPLVGWADARGRYLHSSRPEYYALADEKEGIDLVAAMGDDLAGYRDAIERVVARPRLSRDEGDTAAAHVLAQLQRLGYTGAAGGADGLPSPLEETGLPSPRDRHPEHLLYLKAQNLLNEEKPLESIPLSRQLVAENPRNAIAWAQLGVALGRVGEYEESIRASLSALEHGIEWHGPHMNLGTAHFHLEHWEEALKHFDRALELEPGLVEAVGGAITCCRKLGYEDRIPHYRAYQIRAREQSGQ